MAKPVVIYDSNQRPLAVENGVAIPIGTSGNLMHGRDSGGVARTIATDTGGNLISTISDGATGPAAVKASATQPTSQDKALVVVLSPNQQPIPVTQGAADSFKGLAAGKVSLGGATAGTLQAILATPYNEQKINSQRSISSSSASDTAAGTGARKVTITYLDQGGGGPFTETITLNGVTSVPTVANNISYIESIVVSEVGATGSNVGTITLFVNSAGGGGVIGSIGTGNVVAGVGDNRTFWAHHYIPAGKAASLSTVVVSAFSGGAGTSGVFFLKKVTPTILNSSELIVSELLLVQSEFSRSLGIPITIYGFAKIAAFGVPGTNNSLLHASFDFSES